MSTAQYRQAQQLFTAALVELYELDTTPLTLINGTSGSTGTQYYFTPGNLDGTPVVYQGVTYTAIPIEGQGFEWSGQGKLPQPTLTLSNIGGLATALVLANNDLVGCKVTRTRVFANNLDGATNADATAYFEPDVFIVNRKSKHTKELIEFELRATFDAEGLMLPRRQIIRDACTQTYRYWNATTSAFVYGSCPYSGTNYYDANGNVTSAPTDVCGKKLTDCQLRFGANGKLPTYAFPGAGLANGTP